MSFWSRIALHFKIRGNAALDQAAAESQQVLDYAYRQLQELARQVRQGLLEVATARRQLEQQRQQQAERMQQGEALARQALDAGREDLARLALQRKQSALITQSTLDQQVAEVAAEEEKLLRAQQQVLTRLEDFRSYRARTTIRYTVVEAQARVEQAFAALSSELGEVGVALQQVDEQTQQMWTQRPNLAGLIDRHTLPLLANDGDLVGQELREFSITAEAEAELAALKLERSHISQLPAQAAP